MRSFYENDKIIRISSSVAAGTAVTTSDIVDTNGFDSVVIVGALGAVDPGGSAVMTIKQNTANSTTGMAALADIEAEAGAADDERLLIAEIYRPRERYVEAVVTPGTAADIEIDGIFAILRDPQEIPVVHSTTYVADYVIAASPEEA